MINPMEFEIIDTEEPYNILNLKGLDLLKNDVQQGVAQVTQNKHFSTAGKYPLIYNEAVLVSDDLHNIGSIELLKGSASGGNPQGMYNSNPKTNGGVNAPQQQLQGNNIPQGTSYSTDPQNRSGQGNSTPQNQGPNQSHPTPSPGLNPNSPAQNPYTGQPDQNQQRPSNPSNSGHNSPQGQAFDVESNAQVQKPQNPRPRPADTKTLSYSNILYSFSDAAINPRVSWPHNLPPQKQDEVILQIKQIKNMQQFQPGRSL